ncbi:MAG: O-antigen ligase family protein, partial [Anaeroplasmataceae bacterium]|nr:O-antigen ligase family protein [Anaeroplasmataceae bacterium]
ILFLYDLKYRKKISLLSYGISMVGFFGLAYTFAVAGLVAYTVLLLTTVFLFDPFINRVFNLKTCTFVIVLVVGFVTFFYNPELVNKITGLIGKKGLSSREYIWPLAFKRFLERPVFGYGALTDTQINNYYLYGTTHAHNIILEFLMMTGLIGSFFFVKFFSKSLKICKKEEKRSVYRMFIIGLSSFLICSLFDFYIGLIYFYMFIGLLTFTSIKPVEQKMLRE